MVWSGSLYTLYFALKDKRTPWYAKVAAFCVVAYALSPLDLIPDAIPVLGYLDDLIVVPVGIMLVRRLIPPIVFAECRERAQARLADRGGDTAQVARHGDGGHHLDDIVCTTRPLCPDDTIFRRHE